MMYPFNDHDLLNSCVKTEPQETIDINQSDVISQRGMPENPESSFDAIDHQEVPYLVASSSQASGSKNLQRSYVHESLSQAFDEELIDTRITNDQQLSRNMTDQNKPVKAETIYSHPFPACLLSANGLISPYQLDTPSGSSKKMPLYQISSKNEGALLHKTGSNQSSSRMYSLSSLVETAFGFPVENAKTIAQAVYQPVSTYGGYPSQGSQKDTVADGQGCPSTCPCLCHVPSQSAPSPFSVLNEERPSVIMAPLGRNYSDSPMRHAPLQPIEDNLNKPLSTVLGQEIANRVIKDNLNKPPSIIQVGQEIANRVIKSNVNMYERGLKLPSIIANKVGEISDDSDEEEHLFRVDIYGLRTKFKLTENDWKTMQVNQFPSGGRLLGGAWTSIFKRGVRESNPWCNLRFKNNHVRSENSRKMNSAPFFRGAAECKRKECNVRIKFVIKEERGRYVIVTYTGNVCHKI